MPYLKLKNAHFLVVGIIMLLSSCQDTYDYIYPPFHAALKSFENRKIVMVSESLEDTFMVKTGFLQINYESIRNYFSLQTSNYEILWINSFSQKKGINKMFELILDEQNTINASFYFMGTWAGSFHFDNSLQGFNLAFSGTYDLNGITYKNLLIDYKPNGFLSDPVFIYSIEKGLLMARNPNNLNELIFRCFECE
jgi:hypothetical protein